jgi:hypothetical protein
MSYEPDYRDEIPDLHDGRIAPEEAVSYVLKNHREEVQEALEKDADVARGEKWLAENKLCIDLLSTVSKIDRARVQSSMRGMLHDQDEENEFDEEILLDLATNVCRLLEEAAPPGIGCQLPLYRSPDFELANEPTVARMLLSSAGPCNMGDDLAWAKELLIISRAFSDFLSIVGDGEIQGPDLRLHVRGPLRVFNSYLRTAPPQLLVCWEGTDRQVRFGLCPNPEVPNLASFMAIWISGYLRRFHRLVGLGVCVECGRFFSRERRDKTFCSKTCQNRVAYKRKKILESGAFSSIQLAPDDACDIEAGLWLHHPRFGIGVVEYAGDDTTPMKLLLSNMPSDKVARIRFKSKLSRKIYVRVRFMHGLRSFGYSDLFEGQKREDQLPEFYRLNSKEALARLL